MVFSINPPTIRKVRNPAPEIKPSSINNIQSQQILRMNMIDRIQGATNCGSCKGSK
jgi:hypothetical protein